MSWSIPLTFSHVLFFLSSSKPTLGLHQSWTGTQSWSSRITISSFRCNSIHLFCIDQQCFAFRQASLNTASRSCGSRMSVVQALELWLVMALVLLAAYCSAQLIWTYSQSKNYRSSSTKFCCTAGMTAGSHCSRHLCTTSQLGRLCQTCWVLRTCPL